MYDDSKVFVIRTKVVYLKVVDEAWRGREKLAEEGGICTDSLTIGKLYTGSYLEVVHCQIAIGERVVH